MKTAIIIFTLFIGASVMAEATDFYKIKAKTLDGKEFVFASLKEKSVLFVNTASECGFTGQYKDLQKLHETYKDKNFVVIVVPSNDFGKQEPGSNEEIAKFCKFNYGVDFVMFEKSVIKGDKKSQLYTFLVNGGKEVKWNFEKFLVDGKGKVVGRFESSVKPLSTELTAAIDKSL
ncbi:glutathione peroxidase [Oligoflexaceae bacterium]|nr:glutathione peroxidase [Oligoflexaceae bacterium]